MTVDGPVDAVDVAFDLLVPDQDLESEGDRLGVDAVGPAHADGLFMLDGFPPQDLLQFHEALADLDERLADHHREGRVHHVVRGQPHVDVPAVGPDLLVDRGQEGDDVVLDDLLDGLDPLGVEAGLGLDRLQGGGRDPAQPGPGLADGDFDVQPGLIAVGLVPDGPHFGIGIPFDHGWLPLLAG